MIEIRMDAETFEVLKEIGEKHDIPMDISVITFQMLRGNLAVYRKLVDLSVLLSEGNEAFDFQGAFKFLSITAVTTIEEIHND